MYVKFVFINFIFESMNYGVVIYYVEKMYKVEVCLNIYLFEVKEFLVWNGIFFFFVMLLVLIFY